MLMLASHALVCMVTPCCLLQVELPLGATEDRICGTIDIEKALQEGIKAYEPGLLVRVLHPSIWCISRAQVISNTPPSIELLCYGHGQQQAAWGTTQACHIWIET